MTTSAPRSFLIIQTAFIGDVILATALIEKIHAQFPDTPIDFLLRKGNETLLIGHPFLRNVIVWDKKQNKLANLFRIIKRVRVLRFGVVINVHRFASSGLITMFSKAAVTIGFDKNPLSFFFHQKVKHEIGAAFHEIDRNQQLIESISGTLPAMPRLYPLEKDYDSVIDYKKSSNPVAGYDCIAPTSVWFTKQFPKEKWVALIDVPERAVSTVFLLGAASDVEVCEFIRLASRHPNVINLAGKLNFLQSAALMKDARMNYVNDSAPMHLASAMNAPVTAIYCSTVPAFGFGPLSDIKIIVETPELLSCRPCGLHGFKACPLGHFRCAYTIRIEDIPTR